MSMTNTEDAKRNLEAKESAYNELRTSQKKIEEKLTELKSLKESIKKAQDQNKTASMYFLFLELEGLLSELSIKTPEELQSELYKAWNESDSAKKDKEKKEKDMKTAKDIFEKKQNELESFQKNRRQKILERLEKETI